MANDNAVLAMKQIDPIWKRLYFDRIWKGLSIAVLLIGGGILLVGGQFTISPQLFTQLIATYGVIFFFVTQLTHERYWTRIGWRRYEALNQAQPFIATNQIRPDENALNLPATIQMRLASQWLLIGGVLFFLVIVGLVAFLGISASPRNPASHTNELETLAIILGVLLLLIAFIVAFVYFTALRYQSQTISITEDGIETCYMRQKRRIRWDEARLFAVYDAQGLDKRTFGQTFELSNEHTVVRWSRQLTLFLPHVQSNIQDNGDFNGLIRKVNAFVAAKTNLPLLDLSDRPKARRQRQSMETITTPDEQAQQVPQETTIRLAQNDPLSQLTGWTRVVTLLIVFGLFTIVCLGIGILNSFFLANAMPGSSTFFYGIGILFLFLACLMVVAQMMVQRRSKRLQNLRQAAVQQPERFLVPVQPVSSQEVPQPVKISIRWNRWFFFCMTFIMDAAAWILIVKTILDPGGRWSVALIGAPIYGLVMAFVFSFSFTKTVIQRIEITPEGIATHQSVIDSYLSWQDARLFAIYGGRSALQRARTYELVGEQTAVRWQQGGSWLRAFTIEPKMSQEEFSRWTEQLNGYVVVRTGLPLVELEKSPSQK